ncbi:MAG: Orf2 family protein [Variovorax sp.]|nr:Orf2 family protein [Variovorax sp.]
MINPGPATRVFLAVGPTDLRKGFDGLSDLVRNQFKEDPLSGHMFVFANRNKTRIKILFWDGSGLWSCAKRLSRGTFSWPKTTEDQSGALRILSEELAMLLNGVDLDKTRSRNWWRKAA